MRKKQLFDFFKQEFNVPVPDNWVNLQNIKLDKRSNSLKYKAPSWRPISIFAACFLICVVLIVPIAMNFNNINPPISTESETLSSDDTSTTDISYNNNTSKNSDESIVDNTSSTTTSENNVSIPELPIGVTEIDGKYYLNLEGGNDIDTSQPYGDIDQANLEYNNFETFKAKMKSLDFTEDELQIIRKNFKKDEYGIIFCNTEKFYEPIWVPEDYSLHGIGYFGGEGYTFLYTGIQEQTLLIEYTNIERFYNSKDNILKNKGDYESLKNSGLYKNIQDSIEIVDGIEQHILSYTSLTGYERLKKRWDFTFDNISYTIFESYSQEQNSNDFNLEYPEYYYIFANNGSKSFIINGTNMGIKITKEYVLKFGLK
ncbi:MAG: hypothetical protein A2Y17_05420 [Clostridiales bacterium GWF2_38_85]|nr:MAG: hypothetical protein A2Y17_05420 [Clostridiales bacterium GWF2_38_85]HBL83330.1 hypothetical protein [Clostridiales bacterium]